MAATTAGARLTEQHRRAQIAGRARFLRALLPLWALLDPRRLDATAPAWLELTLGLVREHRTRSAEVAQAYYRDYRAAELGEPAPRTARLVGLDALDDRARSSLIVTGPVAIKSRTGKGMAPERAATLALVEVSGAASRHVLDGGRSELITAASVDDLAVGFARVTDADPCDFCAMVASRGPVYRSRAAAGGAANDRFTGAGQDKFHDGCACTIEPVYSTTADWPGRAREFQALWAESTKGLYGAEARRAFRRALEGRTAKHNTGSRAATPPTDATAARRAQLTAEIAALETTFALLQQRRARGEDVDKPYAYQRDRLTKLRAQLRAL